jgi:hypothetical protein
MSLAMGGLLIASVFTEISLANSPSEELRQGLPGRRISGGSRSPSTACLAGVDQPVIALVPENNLSLTLSEHPTLWFSLPAVSQGKSLEFGLFDPAGELIYQKTLVATGEAGITNLSLPETLAPLATGQAYRWYLSVVCNSDNRSEDLFVSGWVERVQLADEVNQQLASAPMQERIAIYTSNELWHDALTTLAELRRNDPTASQLVQPWNALLEAVDLDQVVSTPFSHELALSPALALWQKE